MLIFGINTRNPDCDVLDIAPFQHQFAGLYIRLQFDPKSHCIRIRVKNENLFFIRRADDFLNQLALVFFVIALDLQDIIRELRLKMAGIPLALLQFVLITQVSLFGCHEQDRLVVQVVSCTDSVSLWISFTALWQSSFL